MGAWAWLKDKLGLTALLGFAIFLVSLLSASRRPKEEPAPDSYKGDALEQQVNVQPIEEQHTQIQDVVKPVAPTSSADINQAIGKWKTLGD